MTHVLAALALVRERPFASLIGAVALALGLVLAGFSLWVLRVTTAAEGAIAEQVVVRARLDPKLDEPATEAVLQALTRLDGVREVAYVGPGAQRDELVAILGEELLAGLDDAVFPRGGLARITLERGAVVDQASLDALSARVAAIEQVSGVERAPFESRHLAFIFDAGLAARTAGFLLAVLALVAGALGVYQRVTLAHVARARELELYRAFGATERWLMARYVWLGLILGAAAAALAIAIGLFIDLPLADLASLLPGTERTPVVSAPYLAGVVIGGLGLALLACLHALRKNRHGAPGRTP